MLLMKRPPACPAFSPSYPMAPTPDTLSSVLEEVNTFQHELADRSLPANQKPAKVFDLLNRLHNTGLAY